MTSYKSLISRPMILLIAVTSLVWAEENKRVWITSKLSGVEVNHDGKEVRIECIQDNENMVDFEFALTSRPCPPFCIQPMSIAPGVETIGELELLTYLRKKSTGDESVMVIDSRDPWWLSSGMIPGATNIPWGKLHFGHADMAELADILNAQFGAIPQESLWNFENAKILILYCNGIWCGQSPSSIKSLLAIGYPSNKLKWYRGGVQAWKGLGLTTVKGAAVLQDRELAIDDP